MIRPLLAHHLAPCEHLVSQISLFAHNKAFMGPVRRTGLPAHEATSTGPLVFA